MLKIVLPLTVANMFLIPHNLEAKKLKKNAPIIKKTTKKTTPTTSNQIAQSNENEVITDIETTADFAQLNNIANQHQNTTYLRIVPNIATTSFPALSPEATQQIAQLKSLKRLVIDMFPLSDSNLRTIAPILSNLTELRFSGKNLTDNGLQTLIGNITNVTILNIFWGSFSEENLSNMLMSIANLKECNFAYTTITDSVVAKILNKFTIERIQLYNCTQITDATIDRILALDENKLKAISKIELGNTRVTADGFVRLKSRFPKLKSQSPFTLSK